MSRTGHPIADHQTNMRLACSRLIGPKVITALEAPVRCAGASSITRAAAMRQRRGLGATSTVRRSRRAGRHPPDLLTFSGEAVVVSARRENAPSFRAIWRRTIVLRRLSDALEEHRYCNRLDGRGCSR